MHYIIIDDIIEYDIIKGVVTFMCNTYGCDRA